MQRQIIVTSFIVIAVGFIQQQAGTNKTSSQPVAAEVQDQNKEAISERLDALRRGDAKTYQTTSSPAITEH
jgi:hypothetical protein